MTHNNVLMHRNGDACLEIFRSPEQSNLVSVIESNGTSLVHG